MSHASSRATAPHNTKKADGIGLISALAFSVGTMVGGGVFALSGTVVNQSGSGAIGGYIIAGVIMMFSALSFAAVAGRAEPGESGYAPIATYLGPIMRFLTMWAFYIMGVALVAFVLVSFGSYLLYFLPAGMTDTAVWWSLGAAVLLVFLNFGSTAVIARAETIMVVFKVSVLFIMIIFGMIAFVPDRLVSVQGTMQGSGSVLAASALLFTAYTGFNVITNMAGQIRNPKRNVPLAILLSLGIVMVLYILVAIAMLMSGVTHFGNAGLAEAAAALGKPLGLGAILGALVALAACVSTLSGANANIIASAQLLVTMSGNTHMPPVVGRKSAKGRPITAVIITGVVAIVLMVSGAFQTIVVLSNVATVIAMVIVNLTAACLAYKKWPGAGMKLPLGMTIPILGILGALSNLPQYALWQNILGFALVAAGLLIYAWQHYRNRRQTVAQQAPVGHHRT